MDAVFESENIIYIRPSFDLVPEYLEMVNDIENVARFIGDRREPLTEQDEIKYISDKMDNNATMFSMIEKKTGRFIGNIEFFNRVFEEAEWGIVITTKMQNKGYGKEAIRIMLDLAFGEYQMHRVSIGVVGLNTEALKFYREIGFKQEGILEEAYYYNNEYSDFIMMRILSHEWK